MSLESILLIVPVLVMGAALGLLLERHWVSREKKEEAKKRVELLRNIWTTFLGDNFYEPIVYEAAKEVAEIGTCDGPNYKKWGQAFRILEELGFTRVGNVREQMSIIHSVKASRFLIDIKWPDGIDLPYIGARTWSVFYLDEKKKQIVRLYSRCRRDALAVFPTHQLIKAKEIQVHNPDGDLTDSLDVKENPDEILVQNSEEFVLYRCTKPQELAEV